MFRKSHTLVQKAVWSLGVLVMLPFAAGMGGGCEPVNSWPPEAPSNLTKEDLPDTFENGCRYTHTLISWQDNSDNEQGFILERALLSHPLMPVVSADQWHVIAELGPDTREYEDQLQYNIPGPHPWDTPVRERTAIYRVKAWNTAGESSYSGDIPIIEGFAELTITKAGTGGGTVTDGAFIDCGEMCENMAPLNQRLELTAIADEGSVFVGWEGVDAVNGDISSVMMDRDREVTVIFNTTGETPPPAEPLNVWATPWSSAEIELEWDHVDGRDKYQIEQFDFGVNDFVYIGDVPAEDNFTYIYPLEPGIEYRFKVSAMAGAQVLASGVAVARTLTDGAAAPLPLRAAPASDTMIVVHWDYVAQDCGYNIYQSGYPTPLNGNNLLQPTVPQITVTELAPDTYYSFIVEEVWNGQVTARGEAGARTLAPTFSGQAVPELLGGCWWGYEPSTCLYAETCVEDKIVFNADGSFTRYKKTGHGGWVLQQSGLVTAVRRTAGWPLVSFQLTSTNPPTSIDCQLDTDYMSLGAQIGNSGGWIELHQEYGGECN